jgi:CIC family chloride channel protein
MHVLGRTLLHAALVGALAGLLGAAFFSLLERTQTILLERFAGVTLLRADGEAPSLMTADSTFRPWLVVLLPAVGALLAGLLMRKTPETRGGGGDAMIHRFHHGGGSAPSRVIWVKGLASILTLGSGGAGGREGPTMQVGGAVGSLVARVLHLSDREQRLLLVAGVAAGLSAVFRTPLGAALLAIEVLYRDDFESEALVPAILASVISYSVVIALHGTGTLFAVSRHFSFSPAHLPLYVVLALLVAVVAAVFQSSLKRLRESCLRSRVPEWLTPALGGLGVGLVALTMITILGQGTGRTGQSLGVLGGGYGAAQLAISGGALVPDGWHGVQILLLLCAAKLVAATFTIGSGGSAGDFAPSLVLGALLGGAFGRAAQLIFHDPTLDAGAFALVGMGTFYGGIAHVPIAALVLTCELAGSYELLVPLMLAGGVAFALLRHRTLYEAQVPGRRESPVHRQLTGLAVLAGRQVKDALSAEQQWVTVRPGTSMREIFRRLPEASGQDAIPVVDDGGVLVGLIPADTVTFLATNRQLEGVTIAADILEPPVSVHPDGDLYAAATGMMTRGMHCLPVTDEAGQLLGLLDERSVFRLCLKVMEGK